MTPEVLWSASTRLYRARMTPLARALKALNFLMFSVVLPYECVIGHGVRLLHRGVGTVVHPNTVIGNDVVIGHGVTIAAGSETVPSALCVTIDDDVHIGAGASIIPAKGRSLRIGAGARIGANSLVIADVRPGETMVAPPAVSLRSRREATP